MTEQIVINFYLIGLIGNLGSGKSTVRKMLERLGASGIDADALAHLVIQRGSPAWRAIVATFGIGVLEFNGRINRRKLGAKVFADPVALQKLEAITHPAVGAATRELLRENQKPIVVIEAIKLVEAGMAQWCDALWAVTCSDQVQIERVMRTRNMSEADARARLATQGSFESKLKLAQVIIDNSGDEKNTRAQVEKAWQTIRPDTARDKREWLLGIRVEDKPAPIAPPVGETPTLAETPAVVEMSAPIAPPVIEMLPPPIVEPTVVVPTPAAVEPSPVLAPPVIEAPQPTPGPKKIEVRRSRRNDLDALGIAINKKEKRAEPLAREEMLKRFGERGYRIAVADKQIVALAAWEAENLVASVREVWAESAEDAAQALPRLFELIESEAHALLCEVVLLMVDGSAPDFIIAQIHASGYATQDTGTLHKLWRQAVAERMQPGEHVWVKKLGEGLITKPF